MATTKKKKVITALALLQSNKTMAERAENYAASIKRNIQRDVIDTLLAKKEKLEDDLFTLSDFTLFNDINQGLVAVTRDQAEARFKKLIETEYNLWLTGRELSVKLDSFHKYFGALDTSIDGQ